MVPGPSDPARKDIVAALNETVERRLAGDRPGTGIPRIIHQTYFTKDLPNALGRNVAALRALNLDWDYRLYDDADIERFIADEYGAAVLARYRRISPDYGAARADLFRYLVVYRHGGVYLDIKSGADLPFDAVLRADDSFVLSQWDNVQGGTNENWAFHPELRDIAGGEFQQWVIIAAPGHPFLRAVIERVLDNIDHYNPYRDGVGLNVIRVTGPITYTLAIAPLLDRHAHRQVANEHALGLRYSVMGTTTSHHTHFRGHYSRRRTPIVGAPRSDLANAPLLAFLFARSLTRRVLRRWRR